MQLGLLLVPALLITGDVGGAKLAALGVSPDTVDANGEKDAVIRVPKTGMVRVKVTGDAGTACSIADHLRGPFAEDGSAGSKNCDVDLLLDAGEYKARLTSPQRGKGTAKIEAFAFADAQPAVKLDEGSSFHARVHRGEEVASWLHIERRQPVTIEVAGRTAGRVALWRDGRWLESPPDRHTEIVPRTGKPLHRWRIDATLEPGEYQLVVYGTGEKAWTKGGGGADDDVVFVTRGAPPGGSARSRLFTIPSWGFIELTADMGGLASFVELDENAGESVTLRAEAIAPNGVRASSGPSCVIDPKAGVPACGMTASAAADARQVLIIEGPPGASGELAWGPIYASATGEGYWPASGGAHDVFIAASGRYFVTAPAFPLSMDAEPLGCALDQVDDKTGRFLRRVAVDAPPVGWTEPFERAFNYNATSTAVWVQIERPGLYSISGEPKTKASCEVFRFDADGSRNRVGAGEDGKCDTTRPLGAGLHEIRFYGGRPGIQKLRVSQVGLPDLKKDKTPAKAACSFAGVDLARGRYRLTTSSEGGASLRGFFARAVPTSLAGSLPVTLDPLRAVSLTVGAGAPVRIHTRAGNKMSCKLGDADLPVVRGTCTSPALSSAQTLTLSSLQEMPFLAVLSRVEPERNDALPRFDPNLAKLPTITTAHPLWFDFDRNQERSMLVQVDRPGLYDLATDGLLATSCRLRTATIADLVAGDRNGRGRNCLVQGYLKPGTYLFTARVQGLAKGRAGVRLVQRAPRDLGRFAVGDEVFFQVGAGELAQQTFDVKRPSSLNLSARALGAGALSCRLDDHDGWPITQVPTPCDQSVALDTGRYILTALPLTVDSRRRTSVKEAVEPVILEGDKTHPLALNTSYAAQLGDDGHDAFSFTLAADLDVGLVLDHGMQGRLYRVGAKGKKEVLDTIPPTAPFSGDDDDGGEGAGEEGGGDEGFGLGTLGTSARGYADDGGEGGEGGDGGDYGEYGENEEGDDGAYAARLRRQREQARSDEAMLTMARATAPREMAPLPGRVEHLAAGSYLIESEHSRGDVAIRYNVAVMVRSIAPGVVLASAPVPGRFDVVMPARAGAGADTGLLRIKTSGDVDVRCRLFEKNHDGGPAGALVAESSDSGADWNCALAVPLAAGHYELRIEAEALAAGTTQVSASFLEGKDTGELKDGDTFKVVAKVASAPLPDAGPDVVQDVTLTSEQDFSCAVQDRAGALLDRKVSVRSCRFLLWPGEDRKGFRVLAWTPDRAASVKVALHKRKVSGTSGGKLDDDEAGRKRIETRGRYLTGPVALCRQASRGGGVLSPCNTAASFEPGDVIVAVPGGGRVTLEEQVANLAATTHDEARALDGTRAAQRQRSKDKSVHLVQVKAPFGSPSSPSCAIEGGVWTHDAATCAAASGPAEESTLVAWTRAGAALDATITRRAAPWPSSSGALAPGTSTLTWTGDSARFSLPSDGFRVKLAIPAEAWAISVDDAGHPRDLCAPHRAPVADKPSALATCVLRGRGGELVVVAPPSSSASAAAPQQARADLLVLATAEAPRALVGLREEKPASPGRERLAVASSPQERFVRVEGWGALACSIHLDDGTHVPACRALLPAGQGAEIRVEHDERPWRVFTYPRSGGADAYRAFFAGRFGSIPPTASSSAPAPLGTALALSGNVVDRRVDLREASAVRVRATTGVCAIAVDGRVVEAEGLGGGCDLVRVLPQGSHRIIVRGFAGHPLGVGNVNVSAEPVTRLGDGVGPEGLVASGDARTFQFVLAADGEVGIGLQTDADTLDCTLLNEAQDVLGDGCHQFHRLKGGTYYLRVAAPDDAAPRRFKPVVFGLKGDVIDVPDEWLRDFFRRAGIKAASSNEVRP